MSTNIQETINRLRELDQEASPAPWWVGSSAESYNAIVCEDGETTSGVLDACYVGERLSNDDPDLQIITETRNALPSLLAEIERLQQIEKGLKERFALIFDKWRSRRRDLIRRVRDEAWEEAWEEGYTEGLLSGRLLERTGVELPHKNPHKENKK